ncbi:hypothetical protein [Paenibacillus chibensis]|uniref:hypothetical protein n=1 Tax=Paenibacillus chibensis TaxID=59846 RepID=UPI000FDADE27|nr:hypothetical protein [Paenibacillus chibensis]MEC0371159.1 hypothetical protein [Paenibacillus chibensis]
MKWTVWLVKTVLTVVLVCGLTLLTTGVIVNSYVQSLLSSFNITLEGQSFSLGGMMKGMLGLGGSGSGDQAKKDSKADGGTSGTTAGEREDSGANSSGGSLGSMTSGSADQTGSGTDASGDKDVGSTGGDSGSTSGSSSTDSGADSSKTSGEDAPIDALPVTGQGMLGESSAENGSSPDHQDTISPDDAAQKKQELTSSEKDQIFNILMTKLPQSELQKISTAMEDGLTAEELQTMEETISKYLTTEEFNVLKQMLEQK